MIEGQGALSQRSKFEEVFSIQNFVSTDTIISLFAKDLKYKKMKKRMKKRMKNRGRRESTRFLDLASRANRNGQARASISHLHTPPQPSNILFLCSSAQVSITTVVLLVSDVVKPIWVFHAKK